MFIYYIPFIYKLSIGTIFRLLYVEFFLPLIIILHLFMIFFFTLLKLIIFYCQPHKYSKYKARGRFLYLLIVLCNFNRFRKLRADFIDIKFMEQWCHNNLLK